VDPLLPIRRLRIELDRTLRSRAFFSRASRGRLVRGEYLDLIVQLSGLVRALATPRLGDLAALGAADVAELTAGPGAPQATAESPAIRLASTLGGSGERPEWSDDVALALLGTAWAGEALEELRGAFPEARRLLSALVGQAPGSLERLHRRLALAVSEQQQHMYALAELGRGALLGVATYLDGTWPAPIAYLSLDARRFPLAQAQRN